MESRRSGNFALGFHQHRLVAADSLWPRRIMKNFTLNLNRRHPRAFTRLPPTDRSRLRKI
jgi:hypothetical protein